MRQFSSIILFAAQSLTGRQQNAWLIDGNNAMGHRGTPCDRISIIDSLKPLSDNGNNVTSQKVLVVFDGRKGEAFSESTCDISGDLFSVVITEDGCSADDYIASQVEEYDSHDFQLPVYVVTADKELRRRVLKYRNTVEDVVNPTVFWRRHRPRLSGFKK
eukprot:CAMPEP_0195530472 /NCGR_PEP_ID=MMETSP0794_2-20130614/33361_1 /TAXON_ID=515487 /ORGANISM="Stephanopyxis turris, Strain CCMP 815" /LENGTH=159 /DNA_ID=CAMNT_0040661989 /DNA_START=160 /DNA_END=639 /DNA_ORIENTATION=+